MTSLYNHNTLGTQIKPLITNLEFKNLCEKVRSGDKRACHEAKEKYSFEIVQKRLVDQIVNQLK